MCGIAGLQGRQDDDLVLDEMLNLLQHRGPDDRGGVRANSWHIGMVRLSIVDVVEGRQPMRSSDGRWWLVFNGEIYNFLSLRELLVAHGATLKTRSDTEVLVELIARYSVVDALQKIEGMFSFAAVDTEKDELWLARDRFGEKPLFLDYRDHGFAFCSELAPLIRARNCSRMPSARGLATILRYGYPWPGLTAFEDVRELKPAHWLRRSPSGEEQSAAYWQLPHSVDEEAGSVERAGQKLLDLLDSSVRNRLIADVPLGLFLSGGIDSGAVAASACEASRKIEAVTVGFEGDAYDETPLARATASSLGIRLHQARGQMLLFSPQAADDILLHYGQPFADTSAFPTKSLAKAARAHFKVVLSGDGGDELLCGYLSFQRLRRFRSCGGGRLGIALSGLAAGLLSANGMWEPATRALELNASIGQGLFGDTLDGVMNDQQVLGLFQSTENEKIASEQLEACREEARHSWRSVKDPILALSLHHVERSLPQDMLMKMDRMSMSQSLEVRAPFLDSRLAEFALSLPTHLKLRRNLGKFLLRHALRGRLPQSVLSAPKHGFSLPVNEWMGREFWSALWKEVRSYNSDPTAELNPHYLQTILKVDQLYCHKARSYRPLHRAWLLYTFLRWRALFLMPSGHFPSRNGYETQALLPSE